MAVVANLDAILGARTEAFVRGIDGAITTTEELRVSLREAGITQREWNQIVRSAEAVTRNAIQPLEQYEQEIRDLDRLLQAGLITQETYNRSIAESERIYQATTPEAMAAAEAQRDLTRALQQAESITSSVATPVERYTDELLRLTGFLNEGQISQETYNRAVARAEQVYDSTSPAGMRAAEAQNQINQEIREAEQLINSLLTPLERYEQEIAETDRLLDAGRISQETYNRAVDRAEDSFRSTLTPLERYDREIDELTRDLRLGTISQRQFNASVRSARGDLRAASTDTGFLAGGADRAGTALLGAAAAWLSFQGALRIAGGIRSVSLELDELAQASDRLTILPDQLQAIRFASQQTSGAAAEQVDDAISDLTIRISEAVSGGGEIQRIFQELNLDVAELNELTSDRQFFEFSDAISSLSNVNDQIRITDELLGDNGVDLVNTFRLGSEEIQRQTAFIRDNNLEISRQDLAQVEELNDVWAEASLLVGQLSQRLVIDLAPALIEIVEATSSVITSFNNIVDQAGGFEDLNLTIDAIVLNVNALAVAVAFAENALDNLNGTAEEQQASAERLAQAQLALFDRGNASGVGAALADPDEIERATVGVNNLAQTAERFRRLLDTPSDIFNRQVSELRATLEQGLISQGEFDQLFQRFEEERDSEISEAIERQQREAQQLADRAAEQLARSAEQLTDSVRTPLEAATLEIERFQDLLQAGAISRETFDRAADREIEALGQLVESQRASQINIGNAIDQGSAEAFNIVFGRQTTDPNTELLQRNNDLTVEMLAEFRAMVSAGERSADASETLAQAEINDDQEQPMNVLRC